MEIKKLSKEAKEEIIGHIKKGESIPYEYEGDLFPAEKKEYELKYAGKERKEVILNDTMSVPFQAVKHFGKKQKKDEWSNMLIFGDNLQALKHLIKLKKEGKLKNSDGTDGVKLVYIDPPFATKQDFKGNQEQKAYQDRVVGSKFIEFIRKRLVLIKELISDDGLLWVHLDQKKGHYIKIILDEIFGGSNFKSEIIWQSSKTSGRIAKPKKFDMVTANLYLYGKRQGIYINKQRKEIFYTKDQCEDNFKFDDIEKKYYKDSPKGNYSDNSIKRLDKINRIYWTSSKTPRIKTFLEKVKINGKIKYKDTKEVDNIWTDLPTMMHVSGNEKLDYPTQKPEKLIERVIKSSSNQGDIVFDCFAGSGTTGAVAEKLGRKWIMADCGKLAIYTMQKRMMNLKKEIGNKGDNLKPKPFTLYHAGLYHDGKLLEKMQGEDYKDFVLELFGCQKREHKINGVEFQGTLNNHSVMVFNKKNDLTEEFIKDELHKTIGKDVKDEIFIIAPAGVVGFNQDYINKQGVKYTILRIPNSIIDYIREKEFTKLEQPRTSEDVNQTIDAVGFDFIYPPKIKINYLKKGKKKIIQIKDFEPIQLGSKIVEFKDPKSEAIAMIMIDLDYDEETFQLDKYWFGDEIKKNDFKVEFEDKIKDKIMIIYLDIFGNEKREVISKSKFK